MNARYGDIAGVSCSEAVTDAPFPFGGRFTGDGSLGGGRATVAASEPVRSPIVVQAGMGAIDTAMGGAMVGALVSMGIAGIAISANMQGVVPSFVQTLYQNMPIFGGVLGGITLVGFFIGFVVGKRGTR